MASISRPTKSSSSSEKKTAADPDRLQVFLDEFKLGDVWFYQEEEGLVKKKA